MTQTQVEIDAQKALEEGVNALGRTVPEIVERIRENGIRGKPGCAVSCILANALARMVRMRTGDHETFVLVDGHDAIALKTTEHTENGSPEDGKELAKVRLSEAAANVVTKFDNHEFPDLEE